MYSLARHPLDLRRIIRRILIRRLRTIIIINIQNIFLITNHIRRRSGRLLHDRVTRDSQSSSKRELGISTHTNIRRSRRRPPIAPLSIHAIPPPDKRRRPPGSSTRARSTIFKASALQPSLTTGTRRPGSASPSPSPSSGRSFTLSLDLAQPISNSVSVWDAHGSIRRGTQCGRRAEKGGARHEGPHALGNCPCVRVHVGR